MYPYRVAFVVSLFFFFPFFSPYQGISQEIVSTRGEAEEEEQVGAERVAKRIGEGKRGRGSRGSGRRTQRDHWPLAIRFAPLGIETCARPRNLTRRTLPTDNSQLSDSPSYAWILITSI